MDHIPFRSKTLIIRLTSLILVHLFKLLTRHIRRLLAYALSFVLQSQSVSQIGPYICQHRPSLFFAQLPRFLRVHVDDRMFESSASFLLSWYVCFLWYLFSLLASGATGGRCRHHSAGHWCRYVSYFKFLGTTCSVTHGPCLRACPKSIILPCAAVDCLRHPGCGGAFPS